MHKAYRVAIADDNPIDLAELRQCLLNAGHQVVLAAKTGDAFYHNCLAAAPDLIVTDVQESGLTLLQEAQANIAKQRIPIVIVTDVDLEYFIDHVLAFRPLAFVTKPVREHELLAAVVVAMQCFEELNAYRAEATNARQALEDRKLIERAKGIVMRAHFLDEDAAFKCLQALARSHRQKLVEVAKCIILADQALGV